MPNQSAQIVADTLNYIERQLTAEPRHDFAAKLDLSNIAGATGYSKFHLHRLFRANTGQTMHSYVLRRRLTEAARQLVFSNRPLIDIALQSGYDSQQAFTAVFKAMYKLPPAEYRTRKEFYPLQFPLHLHTAPQLLPQTIRPARPEDIPDWLQLMRQSVAGYPHWHEADYCRHLRACIAQQQALLIPGAQGLAAALAFSAGSGCIDFLAVQPQYRQKGLAKTLLHKLRRDILPRQNIFTTTFRAGDPAESGQRTALLKLGFAADDLLVEFGYPTQRFTLEGTSNV